MLLLSASHVLHSEIWLQHCLSRFLHKFRSLINADLELVRFFRFPVILFRILSGFSSDDSSEQKACSPMFSVSSDAVGDGRK